MITTRLIGISAKFYDHGTYLFVPGELGLITDLTSCEEAIFEVITAFSPMTVDIYTGTNEYLSPEIKLKNVWESCAYSYEVSPTPTWLTHSSLSIDTLQIDV